MVHVLRVLSTTLDVAVHLPVLAMLDLPPLMLV
jgi:hypothetical protein